MDVLTKIEWFQQELAEEDFWLTETGINNILDGNDEHFEPELIDFVLELEREWDEKHAPDGYYIA